MQFNVWFYMSLLIQTSNHCLNITDHSVIGIVHIAAIYAFISKLDIRNLQPVSDNHESWIGGVRYLSYYLLVSFILYMKPVDASQGAASVNLALD